MSPRQIAARLALTAIALAAFHPTFAAACALAAAWLEFLEYTADRDGPDLPC